MFKFVIPLPKGKAVQVEKDAPALIGMKVGEKFDGSIIGMNGYTLQIAGGSDKEGFPMRRDLPGAARKRALLTKSVGCKKKGKGLRVKKTIRGNRIAEDISQVNIRIIEGKGDIEKLLGLKEEEKPEEPKKEESKTEEKTEKKEEPKKEESKSEEKAEDKKEDKAEEEKEPKKEEAKPEKKADEKDSEKKEEPKKEEKKE